MEHIYKRYNIFEKRKSSIRRLIDNICVKITIQSWIIAAPTFYTPSLRPIPSFAVHVPFGVSGSTVILTQTFTFMLGCMFLWRSHHRCLEQLLKTAMGSLTCTLGSSQNFRWAEREGEGEEEGENWWFLSLDDDSKILIFRRRFPVLLIVLIRITWHHMSAGLAESLTRKPVLIQSTTCMFPCHMHDYYRICHNSYDLFLAQI